MDCCSRIQSFLLFTITTLILGVVPALAQEAKPESTTPETPATAETKAPDEQAAKAAAKSESDSESGETSGEAEGSNEDSKNEGSGDSDLETSLKEVLEGHSEHGDAFNEGPRQRAYLMGGTGNVSFPVTTTSDEAQAFINQGVGQLHGFWYLEAERSFRQAAAIDPDCAMAYWGAAMAAYTKRERSKGFIEKAVEAKKRLGDKLTKREIAYIDGLEQYFSDKEKDKAKRAQALLKSLETIVIDYPEDLEAKAFVAHRIWHNAREGIPISSYIATNSLIDEILAKEPLHPAHHYSIHLWDHRHPKNAVLSAARCGPSAPSIAHMWHMPGHTYSRLKRYEDAVYQQEASARVDHAHMMRDRVMPDEISNFAHNNEWLIRNLIFIGRARDAVNLAKNMIELPQHPKYNTLEKRSGSASYGRRRLLQVLREYQLYEDAIGLCRSEYLEVADNDEERIKSLRLLACSAAILERSADEEFATAELKAMRAEQEAKLKELKDKKGKLEVALDDSKDAPPVPKAEKVDEKKAKAQLKETKSEIGKVERLVKQFDKAELAIEGYRLAATGDYLKAFEKLEKATGEDVSWLGELQFLGGDYDKGIEKVKKQVDRRPKEVIPLARLAYLQFENGDVDLAEETFEKLRDASSSMDLGLELFTRLEPLAEELGFEDGWIKPRKKMADLGYQPPLESLGPFRWSPSPAPKWILKDALGMPACDKHYQGKPVLMIFYLGHGCLHCAEQLHAFAPQVKEFKKLGVDVIAISSDDHDGLQESLAAFEGEMPIRLIANGDLEVFKKFRAFDDFEDKPLHGTFLVDSKGMVRWQDISYEPFMDHEFLLKESARLLARDGAQLAGQSPSEKVSKK